MSTYEPFGKPVDVVQPSIIAEAHGFIGERFDPATQLQYLNARYYDPELALFIQPDWLDPTLPGVGTHRYAYAGQDPVNARDPGGNIKKPPVTDGGPKPGVVGPTHCTRCGSPVGPKDDTGGEMAGMDGGGFYFSTPSATGPRFVLGEFPRVPPTTIPKIGLVWILNSLLGGGAKIEEISSLETIPRAADGQLIFHRLPTDPLERTLVMESGLLWGHEARVLASGLRVQAYPGPAPLGSNGYTFSTRLVPKLLLGFRNGQPVLREVYWDESVGAIPLNDDTLVIPVQVLE